MNMKSILTTLTTAAMLVYFSGCTPPAGDGKGGAAGGGSFQFIFLGLMILVFWMFFIRPQAKRAKNQKKFTEDLQKGDKIVTIAGIHGTINKVNEDGTLQVEVSPGSYLKMEKSAVSMDMTAAVNKPPAAASDKK